MADNQEALDAIQDFKDALVTDGSAVTIRTITAGEWDSYGNVIVVETVSDEITKCFPSSEASSRVQAVINADTNISSYELSLKLYTETEVTKADRIVFDSDVYEILYVSKKIYQDIVVFYELLVKK